MLMPESTVETSNKDMKDIEHHFNLTSFIHHIK